MDPEVPISILYQILAFLLGVVLQALHVFWFYMILKMVIRLATGVQGDMRSDDDEDDEVVVASSSIKKNVVEDRKKQ